MMGYCTGRLLPSTTTANDTGMSGPAGAIRPSVRQDGAASLEATLRRDLWSTSPHLRRRNPRLPGRCSRASAKAVSGARSDSRSECTSRISRTRLPRTARISMFASRITISSSSLSMLATHFLKVVYQFLFAGAACSEKCIQLCGCCPQSSQVYGAFARTGGNVISHGLSVPGNGDRARCLQECCQIFPKLTNTNLLCLHECCLVCTHDNTT